MKKRRMVGGLIGAATRWTVALIAALGMALPLAAFSVPGAWDQPAAALAEQIAGMLGPGQATLTLRNLSTISAGDVSLIHSILEQDLKGRSITITEGDSANSIRVTLSQNDHERLWVAEIVEGDQKRVVMATAGPVARDSTLSGGGILLRSQTVFTANEPILAALEGPASLVAVTPEDIVLYSREGQGWREVKRTAIGQKRALSRDPRAVILPDEGGQGFAVWVNGSVCRGVFAPVDPSSIRCGESDDPWPIAASSPAQAVGTIASDYRFAAMKAFYNAARDYFTGVVAPSLAVDLPPFYTAAVLPRPAAQALLFEGLDGKVQLAENGALQTVRGTRDWGSDFAVLPSGCDAGWQVLVSGSGAAIVDSLRAYELPGQEAVGVSPPLAMGGTITTLWTAADGKNVFAVVRGAQDHYEVDRVTALCN